MPPVATVKLGNAYQFEKFGTGNSLLRYGIRIRCSKRPPPVRDAFSEAFGVKNRLFRYGRDIRYRKRPSGVPNASSKVRKTASCGTRSVFLRHSATKKGSWGTRCVFKGPQNSRLHRLWTASCRSGRIFRGVPCQKQHLPLRQPLQCAKRPPPLSLFAPAPSLAPSTALGTRDGPRSEVSKYKKRMTSKSIKTFQPSPFFYNNQSADCQKLNFSMACTR